MCVHPEFRIQYSSDVGLILGENTYLCRCLSNIGECVMWVQYWINVGPILDPKSRVSTQPQRMCPAYVLRWLHRAPHSWLQSLFHFLPTSIPYKGSMDHYMHIQCVHLSMTLRNTKKLALIDLILTWEFIAFLTKTRGGR